MVRNEMDGWALAAALTLVAAALGMPLLGITGLERIVFAAAVAGGLLYLGSRAVSLVTALERTSGTGRPPLVFLFLPLAFYLALVPWSIAARMPDGDEPWFLLGAHSIAYDVDLDLANNYRNRDSLAFMDRAIEPQPGDPERADGAVHSRHGGLLQAVIAPAYRIGGRAGAIVTVAALAALGAWLLLDLTAFSTDARARLLAWIPFAFGAPFVIYSQQIWAETAAVLLAVAAYRWIARLTSDGRIRGAGAPAADDRATWLMLLLALAALPALKLRLVLVSAALAVILLLRIDAHHRRRFAAVLSLGLAPAGALVLWSNRALFGSVLGMHSWSELALSPESTVRIATGLAGLFFDLAYGLVACAPIWLLLFPSAIATFRYRRRLLFEIALIALPTLLLASTRREWYGGWSPPFRYGLVVLPFLSLLLVSLLERRERIPGESASGPATGVVALALVLATLSGALLVLFVVEPGWTYNLADGRHDFIHYLEARTGVDFARFLPSATRTRTATWLAPVLLIGLSLAAMRVRRRLTGALLAVGLALSLAVAPTLAGSVPTRRIELESAAVERTRGNMEPERWTMDRTRYREGWVLPEGGRAEAKVVPGGDRVEIAVTLRVVRNRPAPLSLVARSGRAELGRLTFAEGDDDGWQTRTLPPTPWPAEDTLVLEVPHGNATPPNGVAIDRVDLRWD